MRNAREVRWGGRLMTRRSIEIVRLEIGCEAEVYLETISGTVVEIMCWLFWLEGTGSRRACSPSALSAWDELSCVVDGGRAAAWSLWKSNEQMIRRSSRFFQKIDCGQVAQECNALMDWVVLVEECCCCFEPLGNDAEWRWSRRDR